MTSRTYCWRRLDFAGLEMLQLTQDAQGIEAHATIIDAGEGQFSLQALWMLDADWRSCSLELTQESRDGVKTLRIERGQRSWLVNDKLRPDLADCLEVDVSATPFCNGLALHALGHEPGELTALYVDASGLSVQPSRQRYERLGDRRWRYVDLGVAKGFEAVLDFDRDGIVERYEGLFERV
jgi:uncharacterized protein